MLVTYVYHICYVTYISYMSHVVLFSYRIMLNISIRNTVTEVLPKKVYREYLN